MNEQLDYDQVAWDQFASAALQGVVASSHTEMGSYISAAHDAARYADAMMIERAQRLAGKPGEGRDE